VDDPMMKKLTSSLFPYYNNIYFLLQLRKKTNNLNICFINILKSWQRQQSFFSSSELTNFIMLFRVILHN
jgi:hypothetical protein